jgi:beta-lactamase superfamily II metal-dependent hydrolase
VFLVGCIDGIEGGGGDGVPDSTEEGTGDGAGEYDDWEDEPPEIEPSGSAYIADGGNGTVGTQPTGSAEVHFVDVGQADFTLFEGPEANVVVDTADWQDENVVPYLRGQGIEEIDLVLVTHPDADHIGQLDEVMNSMEVEEVWMSGTPHTTQTYEDAVDAVLGSDAGYYEPRAGEEFVVGRMHIEALHPEEGKLTGDVQKDSVAVRVVYGETSFLMTGDAGRGAESEMVEDAEAGKIELDSDVYQMGHHGSSTSSRRSFLEAVNPDVAVYSAGEGNSFGHPDDEVIERHAEMGIDVYGTDKHGTVVVETGPNGSYTVETEKDAPLVVPFVTPTVSATVSAVSAVVEYGADLGRDSSGGVVSVAP